MMQMLLHWESVKKGSGKPLLVYKPDDEHDHDDDDDDDDHHHHHHNQQQQHHQIKYPCEGAELFADVDSNLSHSWQNGPSWLEHHWHFISQPNDDQHG